MTKEQAIKELRISECYSVMPSVEALDMAIKALEQQSSEDCVSRADVLKQVEEWRDNEFMRTTNAFYYLEKRVKSLSPVTPTRKVGKWIELEDFDCSDKGEYLVKCSICGSCNGYNKSNYCHNCGAEMRGNTKRKGEPIEGNNGSYNCENWIP